MHAINYTKAVSETEAIREVSIFGSKGNDAQLRDACNAELDFLARIDRDGHLYYDEDYLDIAIRRYEKYWLPLLASLSGSTQEDLKFAPPLDVHWVWHVHMLAPVQYRADCAAVLGNTATTASGGGRVLNHALQAPEFYNSKRKLTKLSWQERY